MGEERRVEEAWIPVDRANAPMDNLNSVAFIFSVVSVGEDVVKVSWMVLIEQVKIRMEEGGWKR